MRCIGGACAEDPRDDRPLQLIISYHTAPRNRPALRAALQDEGVRRFGHWKAISDDEHHIRNELQLVIADPLVAR
jgi:hypothetical protein